MVNEGSGLQPKTTQLTSYHAVSNSTEENESNTSDEEEGACFSDYAWNCTTNLEPQSDAASWPASFNNSAAFLLRQAPTITAYEGRDEIWSSVMTWGTPIGRFGPRDRELLRGMSSPQRLRGYSDDAPILKLKLPLHDAKLSDTTWLSKARVDLGMDPSPHAPQSSRRSKDAMPAQSDSSTSRGGTVSSGDLAALLTAATEIASAGEVPEGPTLQQTQELKNHPAIRAYRDEYLNWRRGALRGRSGEELNDLPGSLGDGGEESKLYPEALSTDDSSQALPEALLEVGMEGTYVMAPLAWDDTTKLDESALFLDAKPALRSAGPSMEIAEIPPYVPKEQDKAAWLELEGEAVGSTLTQTVFNGVNAFAGLTQFVLPSIMANVGWIFVPLMFSICATSLYTVSLLEACQIKTGSVSFPDVAEAAFGPMGRYVAGMLAYVDMFALIIGSMLLTAHSSMEVFEAIYADDSLNGGGISTSSALILVALAFLPTCLLKDLTLVSFLSMGGLIATLATSALVIRKAMSELDDDVDAALSDLTHLGSHEYHSFKDYGKEFFGALIIRAETQTEPVGPKPFLPLSLLLYQFTLQSLFPSLRASMAKPQEAQRMAKWVLGIVAGSTLIFASTCYVIFGPGIPEQVTSELGTGTVGLLANCMIIWSSYTKFPLGLFPVCDAVLELFPTSSKEALAAIKTSPGMPRSSSQGSSKSTHGASRSSRQNSAKSNHGMQRSSSQGYSKSNQGVSRSSRQNSSKNNQGMPRSSSQGSPKNKQGTSRSSRQNSSKSLGVSRSSRQNSSKGNHGASRAGRQNSSKGNQDPHGSGSSSRGKHDMWTVRFARFFAVGFTLMVAVTFPGFSVVIGFCSWIFAPSLMVAIPIACYLRLFPEVASGRPVWRRLHQAAIIGGVSVSIIGTAMPFINAIRQES